LIHIDISSIDIGPKGATEIFRALQVNESVISLDVSSREGLFRNRISEVGLRELIPVLENNKILTMLSLSGNSIRTSGLEKVVKGLTTNRTLLSLKIANNEIEGNERSLKALKAIATIKLQELDISDNALGNYCFEEFTVALCSSGVTLKYLYCSSISINCTLNKSL
jgi:Ran GTPase-activating protein (RanGAP) involved in mRNA processing and transport